MFIISIDDLVASLDHHSQIVVYADDAKIFALWVETIVIQLNIAKCNVVTFIKSKILTIYRYLLGNKTINMTISVKDVGVSVDSNAVPELSEKDDVRFH